MAALGKQNITSTCNHFANRVNIAPLSKELPQLCKCALDLSLKTFGVFSRGWIHLREQTCQLGTNMKGGAGSI